MAGPGGIERHDCSVERRQDILKWSVITRFAPAPTGYLHLGHVVNALHVWQAAHDRDGRVLLRIEDHDRQRSRPEYEAAILEDLAWLGFQHDGPLVRQSERDAVYRKALQPLIDRELVYGCRAPAPNSRRRQSPSTALRAAGSRESRFRYREHLPRPRHSAHGRSGVAVAD